MPGATSSQHCLASAERILGPRPGAVTAMRMDEIRLRVQYHWADLLQLIRLSLDVGYEFNFR